MSLSGAAMLAHLLLERLSLHPLERIPEPRLIMDDPVQVEAFMESGQDNGVLASLYLYHALQASPVVRPGDRVLDLACGPANQLLRMARLNPDAHFHGLDASTAMLDIARSAVAQSGVGDVDLTAGDMSCLSGMEDASVDCVMCTMSLHHLPGLAALEATLAEARRVLRRDGGLYIADFGRLKRVRTQHFFAKDRADCQSAQFTQDYLQSLAAAFSVGELSHATRHLGQNLHLHRTPLAPFMVIIKSADRRQLDDATRQRARAMFASLDPTQQRDFHNFARWFRTVGFGLPCALA